MKEFTIFLNHVKQLNAFIGLVEKFKPFQGQKLSDDQWANLFRIDEKQAYTLLSEALANTLAQLVQAFPKKEELKGDPGQSIKGDPGTPGPTVAAVVEATREHMLKLVAQIEVPEEKLEAIKNSLQADLDDRVSKIKLPVVENTIVKEPQIFKTTEIIERKTEVDFAAELLKNKFSVRNALEAIDDEDKKLALTAVGGLQQELADLRKLIQNIKIDRVDYWGGGLDEGEVLKIVNDAIAALPPGGGGGVWGSITGTLSDQTDLQAALDSKAATSHTHTASQVTDFNTATDARIANHVAASDPHTQYQKESEKGAAGGYAELDGSGKVPSAQLPSFVDDVLEYANFAALPVTGESGKIYVTLDDNKTYRWSGSAYAEISSSLALGETSTTAYRGDRGKTAYDHSQVNTGNPHNTTASDIPNTPAGNIAATTVQAALNELDSEKAPASHTHSGLAPAGGSTGQVLKKNSNTDYDYSWGADNEGAGGGLTAKKVQSLISIRF